MKVTDYLAIYGALLSTFVFFWNASRSKPSLRVRLVHAAETEGDVVKSGIRIEVQNPSLHKAHLNSVLIVFPFRKAPLREHLEAIFRYRQFPSLQNWCHTSLTNFGVDDGCPISIEPHKSHGIFIERTKLDEFIDDPDVTVIRVVAQDALWQNRYSKPFNYH